MTDLEATHPDTLGRDICGDWNQASRREWLVTNGMGGFACGTVAQAATRRYHSLLIARPPQSNERVMFVSKLDIDACYRGVSYALTANEFEDGTIAPAGFVHIHSFELRQGVPTWTFACADAVLEQQIFMAPGAHTSYVSFQLLRSSAPLQLTLRPLYGARPYHAHTRGVRNVDLESGANECRMRCDPSDVQTRMCIDRGEFQSDPSWYWNFHHREEAERGLDAIEDLFVPGRFRAGLETGQACALTVSIETDSPGPAAEVLSTITRDAAKLQAQLPPCAPAWIRQLALASDQFIERGDDDVQASSAILAGYPWFSDWSRDALVSLPGLTVSLGRMDLARDLIDRLLRFEQGGLLPNRFSDHGEPLDYNTVDAALWLFNAVDEYVGATSDTPWLRRTMPALLRIVQAHIEGTRFGIGVDPVDGLLHAGAPGLQLTWMDAKVGDRVITARRGKPVEINALWLNALDVTLRLSIRIRDSKAQSLSKLWLARARCGFARFWNPSANGLYDVIDVDGGPSTDSSLRPNQIFAVSLPYSALSVSQMRAVVDTCGAQLLTGVGLRSLGTFEPSYQGRYGGDPGSRDGAYHQGTVWSWLLGPFAWAHFRAHGDARLAKSFLEPMALHLREGCIGSISEIFDGDAPHAPRGCFAQAWGVAETLRVWLRLDREVRLIKEPT